MKDFKIFDKLLLSEQFNKSAMLFKSTYFCSTISIKLSTAFWLKLVKTVLKSIWKHAHVKITRIRI